MKDRLLRGVVRAALAEPLVRLVARRRQRDTDVGLDRQVAAVLELQRLLRLPALDSMEPAAARSFAEDRLSPLDVKPAPMDKIVCRYYLRLSVVDRPGTLAKIAAILAAARIGISSVVQPENEDGDDVPLILMTHDATNAAMNGALRKIGKLNVVKAPPVAQIIRHEAEVEERAPAIGVIHRQQ